MKKAVIDIDGVLNDYPKTQLNFFNKYYAKDFEVQSLGELKKILSYQQYCSFKEDYRNSDYKHDAEPKKYAKELLQYLEENDYLIYIITARKLFVNNQLERTITWLKKNKLRYDYIYCTQKKDFTIFEKFGKIDIVIEDNCDNIKNIAKINGVGYYFIVNNSDNQLDNTKGIYKRVDSLKQILEYLEEQK